MTFTTTIMVATLLLLGLTNYWLHKRVLPKYSEATKLWVALIGATLLVGLLVFSPAHGSVPNYVVFLVIIAWALTDRFKAYHRKKSAGTA